MASLVYYKILWDLKTASINDIKKSYRKLAIQYHPDRNESKDALDKSKELSHVYEVLSDPQKESHTTYMAKQLLNLISHLLIMDQDRLLHILTNHRVENKEVQTALPIPTIFLNSSLAVPPLFLHD